MKELIRRLNNLSPQSILTATQRKRLVDALGESLATIAEKNLSKSKAFIGNNQHERNRIINGYITTEERKEVARILNDPSIAIRMKEFQETSIISGNLSPSALSLLKDDELDKIIHEFEV